MGGAQYLRKSIDFSGLRSLTADKSAPTTSDASGNCVLAVKKYAKWINGCMAGVSAVLSSAC